MIGASQTAWYSPGSWVAVVGPVCALVIEADPDSAVFVAWGQATTAGAGADDLLALATARGASTMPSFALVEPRADGLRVVLRGTGRLWTASGEELGSDGAASWRDAVLPLTTLPVRIGGPVVDVPPYRLPLSAGAALAAAVDLYPADVAPVVPPVVTPEVAPEAAPVTAAPAPEPAPAAPAPNGLIDAFPWAHGDPGRPPGPLPDAATLPAPDPTPAPVPATDWASAPVSSPWLPPDGGGQESPVSSVTTPVTPGWTGGTSEEPERADHTVARSALSALGPTVVAVYCPAGHQSPVHAQFCRVCDLPIPPNQPPMTIARPILGQLRLPNGQTIPLDRGVVLGRSPSPRESPSGEQQHVVSLASPEKDISRNHLEIRLDGWHVLAVDLGSVNGTVVVLPGRPPQRLRPDEPMILERGATLTLADELTVAFEVPA